MVPAPVVIFGPVFPLGTGRPSARLGECAGAPSHLRPGDRGQPESLTKMQVLVRALGLRRQVLSERCLRTCCVAGLRTQEAGRKAKHLYSAGSFFIFDSQNICLQMVFVSEIIILISSRPGTSVKSSLCDWRCPWASEMAIDHMRVVSMALVLAGLQLWPGTSL